MIKFERISIALLDPNTGQIPGVPKNPRKWGRRELQNLANSMKDTPELTEARGCIVVPWQGRFVVLGGNMRLAAAKAHLDWTELMCAVLPEGTSADRMREIVQKDNSSFGQFDYDILRKEWLGFGYDYQSWGLNFDTKELELEPEEAKDDNFDVDRALEGIKKTRSQRGDIWQLGDHYLMCGDSTSAEDVDRLMDSTLADLSVTDPPYNVEYEGKTEEALTIENDAMSSEEFRSFLTKAFKCAFDNIKQGAAFYVWYASREHINFESALNDVGLTVREQLIWVKNSLVLSRQDYHWRHEPCLYGWKEGAAHKWYSDRTQTTVLQFNRPTQNREHPTMKPIDLIAYLVNNSSKKNDIVLDLFGGSGSTLIACEQLGRKCYTMELDERYCDVIIKRWETLTGKKAVKL